MTVRRSTRKKPAEPANGDLKEETSPTGHLLPAGPEEKKKWQGFCEIESEPAFFNVMLKDFGVRGVKVQEVISLDEEVLMFLARPIYGLIFLFRWQEDDSERQEQSCPDDVWFANQTVSHACASVALLNIVNNIPDIELGENLETFKAFTSNFSPALRGDAISNFEFVKGIHNSFARKMDMLNTDLFLRNEAKSKGKGKKRKAQDDEDESGFHFIAFMPIGDKLWKLDGLERQPTCLGAITGDWIDQARPDILARMAQSEEQQIEFVVMSLAKDPLQDLISSLATNVKSIQLVEERVKVLSSKEGTDINSALSCSEPTNFIMGPDPSLGLTQMHIGSATVPSEVQEWLDNADREQMPPHLESLKAGQRSLSMAVQEELQVRQHEEDHANARRRDVGGLMQKFAQKVKQKLHSQEAV